MIFHFELFDRHNWGEVMDEKSDGFARNGKYVSSCGGKPVTERQRETERETER
jgi:hypothetical protein